MDAQQQLIGLMTVAEEHHQAVQTALDGLAAERAALEREREAFARAVKSAQEGLSGTIKTAAHESLVGASNAAVSSLKATVRPFVEDLKIVTDDAQRASDTLRGAVGMMGWKHYVLAGLTGIASAVIVGALLIWQMPSIATPEEIADILKPSVIGALKPPVPAGKHK
jgi:hypothetical protein